MEADGTAASGTGKLILVPTPIGNLEDITFRAIRILKEVELILAEDTRTSKRLLAHYQIDTPLKSHHIHNEHRSIEELVDRISGGSRIALVSDAGTPGISDPGFLLTRACREANLEVECLPGATAFVPALVVSGIPTDRFCFEGFLPPKKGRQTRLAAIAQEQRTTVLYESPHRILKLLDQLKEHLSAERRIGIFRELSKLHEEHSIGNLEEVQKHYQNKASIKGEIVVVIAGADK